MDTSNECTSFFGSAQSSASSALQGLCFCERPTVVKTANTEKNFGRRFVSCENWKINQDCGFFEWLDPKMCSFGRKVVHRLHQRHEYLEAQAKRCETLVEVEVGKVRAENEKKIAQLKAEMESEISQYRK
ncbi:uncharacterized protein LOC132165097 [Corylus avellana]|uniref:uncharacterized protein LOC132165097 n=1 Tax=Corylus avellana TaxID=13451 RepID=UPI00286C0AA7|nr:uncharacterized protein LOC132165097 [Corylus avellana]